MIINTNNTDILKTSLIFDQAACSAWKQWNAFYFKIMEDDYIEQF